MAGACIRAGCRALRRRPGVIATDSPQPQAEVWFGLLKTNCDESLVVWKSISVPSRNRTALGSIRTFTPLSSITSSSGLTALGIFHRVGHPGAAAVLDPDPHAQDGLVGPGDDVLDAVRRRVGQGHHFEAWQSHSSLLAAGFKARAERGYGIICNHAVTERRVPGPVRKRSFLIIGRPQPAVWQVRADARPGPGSRCSRSPATIGSALRSRSRAAPSRRSQVGEVVGGNREGDVQRSVPVMGRNGSAGQRHGLERRPALEQEQDASSGHVVGAKPAVLGERGETEHRPRRRRSRGRCRPRRATSRGRR